MSITVTGAYGYSGRYIADAFLAAGKEVNTLTDSPNRTAPNQREVPAFPYSFDNVDRLARTLENTRVLVNTYWVRYNTARFTIEQAVDNSRTLFRAAKMAGVERIVHTSILNPSKESPLPYYRGKALVEEALEASGVSHAILRPAILFGAEDILINNIAWGIRHAPVFGILGNGEYHVQPIFVEDFAHLAVHEAERRENKIVQAVGPDLFTFKELVAFMCSALGVRRPIACMPPSVAYPFLWAIGKLHGDVLLTRHEISALMDDLLWNDAEPAGRTSLKEWILQNHQWLGRKYRGEIVRRTNRVAAYKDL